MTQAKEFADKFNKINKALSSLGEQTDPEKNIHQAHLFFKYMRKAQRTSTLPIYEFEDGTSVIWWVADQKWYVSDNVPKSAPVPDESTPPKQVNCRCSLGQVKSQRRRAQRDLNQRTEELFQSRARVLQLEAELKSVREEIGSDYLELYAETKAARQRADESDAGIEMLNERIDQLEKENKLVHTALNVANISNADQLGYLVHANTDLVSARRQIEQLEDQLILAKSAASKPAMLKAIELIDGVLYTWFIKQASGHIVIGVAITEGWEGLINRDIMAQRKDLFPHDVKVDICYFEESTGYDD